jgi:ferritin
MQEATELLPMQGRSIERNEAMISNTITTAFNNQIQNELESAYIYLSMVAYLEANNLPGMAHWMRAQVHEENMHAMRQMHHISERGGTVKLADLKQLSATFESVVEIWEKTLEHECFISSCIYKLMKLVRDECDYASEGVVAWFVSEQIEEEANVAQILEDVRSVAGNPQGLLMLDRELAARAFPVGSPFDPAAGTPA